jgi:phage tail-like protein
MAISLFNERHETVAAWTVAYCFLIKVTAPNLKSNANKAAIENLENTHVVVVSD